MRRYPFYLTLGEAEFISMLLEEYEMTRGFREREGLRKLRSHLTRGIEKVVAGDSLVGGEQ